MQHFLIQTSPVGKTKPETWEIKFSFKARSIKAAQATFDQEVAANPGLNIRVLNIWCGGQKEVASIIYYKD